LVIGVVVLLAFGLGGHAFHPAIDIVSEAALPES
jgi:hypothetical protein